MSKLLLALMLVCALGKFNVAMKFSDYVKTFNKNYELGEHLFRQSIFEETLKRIEAHNSNPANTWTMGITEFSDWTKEEFKSKRLGAWQNCSATTGTYKSQNLGWLPTSIDWRAMGVVTPVKNQGNCGSCWAFSTTGAMESHWAISTQQGLPELSEQQLVDCAGSFNNFGCDGGLPSQAFEYIMYNKGLTSESQYPYTAVTGTCQKNYTVVAYAKGGAHNITYLDENALQEAIAFHGPVSIAFEVVDDFMDYTSGVYSSTVCSNLPQNVNHAVLAVGYGVTSAGVKYYIVKNSWGTSWGLQGYFWIQRGVNMCGVADCASFPIIY